MKKDAKIEVVKFPFIIVRIDKRVYWTCYNLLFAINDSFCIQYEYSKTTNNLYTCKQGTPTLAVAIVIKSVRESVRVGNCYYRELLFG